ncbi:MAG TPA: hypothetical protein VJ849_04535, partial [Actinomycetes bacterium]|nr:hypothetical protein [Actinomycetes bacterium]
GLVDLRHRLEEAVERGRPLWPVTTYVEYRMALDGPAAEAASVLRPGAARFALGPFWAGRLGRDELTGFQASTRGGLVQVRPRGDRVLLGGHAVTVLRGQLV